MELLIDILIEYYEKTFTDEYYICINGRPVLFVCRDGQHWNKVKQYCDDIHAAGCDVKRNLNHI